MIESGLQNLSPSDLLLKTQSMINLFASIKAGLAEVAHSVKCKFPDIELDIRGLIPEFCPILEQTATLAMKEIVNS
ncbi:MAG: hypothetical protein LBF42_04305 [Puniceicoccales bacterium]|jgi:hypothetical protein|nr:hypothetical protein [Puniceicoccales bacterium]